MLDYSTNAKAGTLRIVDRSNPILWEVAAPVSDIATQVVPYIDEMRALMRIGPVQAVGLSGPQVGVPFRFFLTKYDYVSVVINPVIVERSPTRTSKAEGCMSWNGGKSRTYVSRHDWIVLRYTDRLGVEKTERITGFEARVVQHECDHLDGQNIFPKS